MEAHNYREVDEEDDEDEEGGIQEETNSSWAEDTNQ